MRRRTTAPFFCSTNAWSFFLYARERVTSSFCSRHHGTTTSFMKALSLSKSTPRKSQGNRPCARLIASTTSEPSRVSNGRHSVQPVATSTIVRVWMNEPATDGPPWGERRRAGNGIRDVIVAAVGMRDGVPANRAGATLKLYDLASKTIIARQDDAATVQKRQQIAEQFTLGLLGQVVRDAMLAEQLARKLAGVSVAGHTADTIGFQQRREVIDHRIRRERRAGLANGVDDNPVFGLMRNCQREAVIGAAARISESSVKVGCGRQHLAIVASAGLDHLE